MTARRFSLMDQLIIGFDRGLATLFNASTSRARRACPGENLEEYPLTDVEKRHVIGLMRVNHSGEVSAQALYQGQGLTARDAAIRDSMQRSAIEEVDHLAWCEQRLHELNGHTSILNPIWYLASFTIGALAGFCGDKWSLGFITETERQVVRHLQGHLQSLPGRDAKSRAILEQMQIDEGHHATVALEAGAAELPRPVKQVMHWTSQMMTGISYWV
ncbi:MAG: 3-demethoxyubiquinol 3-hydroxylase [Gammaproteobacteria bacterium]|nr:3-demethoxyubiquinol 3-hydroxylase [Gammaproteobacteria bacterium]